MLLWYEFGTNKIIIYATLMYQNKIMKYNILLECVSLINKTIIIMHLNAVIQCI